MGDKVLVTVDDTMSATLSCAAPESAYCNEGSPNK